jgi:hypothetical protein
MKEDVLEQVVDDYLQFEGYFTTHNVRFKPSKDDPGFVSRLDSVPSDVDVVGYHPKRKGHDRVAVVSCKAWQVGFDAPAILARLNGTAKNPKRPRELQFRELWLPKWADAFIAEIEELTGQSEFTYYLAVTRLRGDGSDWASDPNIRRNLRGNPFQFLTLQTMWSKVLAQVTSTPASSEMGRLAQILKAAGLTAPQAVVTPAGPTLGSDAALEDRLGADGTDLL